MVRFTFSTMKGFHIWKFTSYPENVRAVDRTATGDSTYSIPVSTGCTFCAFSLAWAETRTFSVLSSNKTQNLQCYLIGEILWNADSDC